MKIPAEVIRQSSLLYTHKEPVRDIALSEFCPAFLSYICTDRDGKSDETAWTTELVDHTIQHHPELSYAIIIEALRHCQTSASVAVLAAGPMEDLLAHHGRHLIDQIETDAKKAPRVRFLLSGVWRSEICEEVWARIFALRETGPNIDSGAPLPSNSN